MLLPNLRLTGGEANAVGRDITDHRCGDVIYPGSIVTMNGEKTDNFAPIIDQATLDAFDESLRYDLLDPFYPIAEDTGYGGFVEKHSFDWTQQQDSDKFVVAQAQIPLACDLVTFVFSPPEKERELRTEIVASTLTLAVEGELH